MRRRSSKHGARPDVGGPDDSLALLAEEDRLLVEIFNGWDTNVPPPDAADPKTLVSSGFERGTYGKLLIQNAALRVAAKEDVARALHAVGSESLAGEFTRHLRDARRALDRLDELARGVDAMGLASSVTFDEAVGELAALIRADLGTELLGVIPHIEAALGERRAMLHSARWVRHHAPTHPAQTKRWYSRIPLVVRVKARYDHLRGFPWAQSSPMSDSKVAGSIETEP